MWDEVKILKPSIVVLVGSTAKKVFKEKEYEARKESNGSEIFHVPFPTKRINKKTEGLLTKNFKASGLNCNLCWIGPNQPFEIRIENGAAVDTGQNPKRMHRGLLRKSHGA